MSDAALVFRRRAPGESGAVGEGTRAASGSAVPVDDAVSTKKQKSQPLYANRVKIYPKRVSGTFRRLKWATLVVLLAVYYLVPWIRWDRGPGVSDQAVLIDMPGRRAYFFGIEIWPQEVYYLTGLLLLGALGLFLATSLAGRVWCGYACPQTVWTDLYMWVERLIEGDRNARVKLDKAPLSPQKAAKKTLKHAAWLLIALLTGGAWIMYFNDGPTVVRAFFTGEAGLTVYFFVGLFTATTYVLAGWAREQVCTYMCPWPRFQGALLDEDSLIVTYQAWRGEPRGKHKAGESWEGRGGRVAFHQCVSVCPTGHRHPRRAADGVHRLRPLRRRLRQRDGQGRSRARPHHLGLRAQRREPGRRRADRISPGEAAHDRLRGDARGGRAAHAVRPRLARDPRHQRAARP
jgi:4Fe-4S dicluster domain/4Fe-4S binding domain